MAFITADHVPPDVSLQVNDGVRNYCDSAGHIWYQPEGHDLWCCRGESTVEFHDRLKWAKEVRHFSISYPNARAFGPVDERFLHPLTDYEKDQGFAFGDSLVFGCKYLIVPKDWIEDQGIGF